ncbi:uncharacterized protein LY89DRAFT_308998 [Mollisia scopiformis]|uniref:Protein kinase domain-containing protein n=1 Tax=Mollisia scopiformis TaxID=149040 RepID=A0A194XRQ9_MOLSC|nr:uncharacterized protein LY89DRAFT_308998 [Mollisia scopiformis]KUJ22734.1 hypothetical protein LY89DRAFT_308998 [Mollisia scopiformis]
MNDHSLVSSKRSERALETRQTSQSGQNLQASTNLQATYSSNHIGGTTLHALPLPANDQPTNSFHDAGIIERPSHGIGGRGLNTDTLFNQSALGDPPPDPSPPIADDIASGRLPSFCIAGPGYQCWCERCAPLATTVPIAPSPSPYIFETSTSNPSYSPYQRPDLQSYPSRTIGSSAELDSEIPGLTYSNTINNGSDLARSSYGSLPASSSGSGFSFDPSLSRTTPNFSSGKLSSGFPSYDPSLDDMRGPRPHVPPRVTTPYDARQPSYKERAQRRDPASRPSINASNIEPTASLDCAVFLEAQDILRAKLRHGKPLSETQKESLANVLDISSEQLEFCLTTKRVIEPLLNNIGSKAHGCGLPSDYVVGWFEQLQSSIAEKAPLRDSAYQSLNTSLQVSERPKKRRRITRNPSSQRTYQCTHISSNRTFCLQESNNFTDWKRHEERHCPQRRWECLLEGSYPDIQCHICGHYVDADIQQAQETHARCFGRDPRKGHDFPRKDKLVPHIRDDHGFEPRLEAWHYPIPSMWKEQCGFCGERFSDWDTRCDHVGKHFTEGKRMIPDWRDPWPVEETSDAPDEDNDNDNDNDKGGPGDHRHDGPGDKDADGEDDPDHNYGPEPRRGKSGNKGQHSQHSQSHGFDHTDDRQNHHSSRTYSSGNGNRQDDCRGRQTRRLGHAPSGMHQNLSLRQSPKIRGPEGNDDIFKSVGKLGYGTFGFVDEVEHATTKIHFARKTIRITHQQGFVPQRELAALRNLKHVHIVNLTASYVFEDQFSIIMSPVADCNLSDYMLREASSRLELLSNLARWIGCLASALSYLHEKSYQHLDIKPSNILVANGQVVLSDFGGAVFWNGSLASNVLDKDCAVTPMYCAPEIADRRGASFIAGASDVYSLGCVFLEMATVLHRESLVDFEQLRAFGSKDAAYHRNPRKSLSWIDHLWDIDGSLGLPLSEELFIIQNMLSEDWIQRPTARDIEDSLHLWHLQSKYESGKSNYLIVSQTDDTGKAATLFDPLAIVRQWLHKCRTSHTNCLNTEEAFSPFRILNVGIEGDTIRLESSDPSSPYVALSYCWGKTQPLKTTLQTLDRMSESIPVASLSNTFFNAVKITRALGFHYLWIDALCIVQDSKEDWTTQVGQMSKIYSRSTLTICIANDAQTSVPTKHKMIGTKPTAGRLQSPCSTCDNGYKAFRPLVDNTVTTMLLDSKWSKRGWTLQERILSPRILYYSSTSLAWECDGERSTLDRVGQIRDNLKKLGFGQNPLANKQEANPSFSLMRNFRKTWRDIVREFSKRQLSYAEDKLPALSGIASAMAAVSRQTYVAGLWMGNLINDLLWCRDFATIPILRPKYRAPSWSWAAIDSPVFWSKSLDCPVEKYTRVLDCQTEILSPLAPFAEVSDGYLEIEGLSRKVVVNCARPEEVLDWKTLERLAFAQWDTLDVHKMTSPDPRLKGIYVEELLCLQVLSEVGLLLRKVMKENAAVFQRVGVYWNQTDESSRLTFNESWKVRSLTII